MLDHNINRKGKEKSFVPVEDILDKRRDDYIPELNKKLEGHDKREFEFDSSASFGFAQDKSSGQVDDEFDPSTGSGQVDDYDEDFVNIERKEILRQADSFSKETLRHPSASFRTGAQGPSGKNAWKIPSERKEAAEEVIDEDFQYLEKI